MGINYVRDGIFLMKSVMNLTQFYKFVITLRVGLKPRNTPKENTHTLKNTNLLTWFGCLRPPEDHHKCIH